MRVRTFLLCACLCLSSTGAVEGGFTYISQNRSVSASNTSGSAMDIVAPDLGSFQANAGVSREHFMPLEWKPSPGYWYRPFTACGGQDSMLGRYGISASGAASTGSPNCWYTYECFAQSSSSYFEVIFETTLPQRFALTGYFYSDGDYGGESMGDTNAWATLSGASGEILAMNVNGHNGWIHGYMPDEFYFDKVILLEPGCYTLRAGASAWWDYGGPDEMQGPRIWEGGDGDAYFDLQFTPIVPVPAAILLGTIGAGPLGWLRRRRSL